MHVESMTWARQTLGYPPPPFMGVKVRTLPAEPMGTGDAEIPADRYAIGMNAMARHFDR